MAQSRIGFGELLDAVQRFLYCSSIPSAKTRQLLLALCNSLVKLQLRRFVEQNFQALSYFTNTSSAEMVSISPRSAASIRASASFAQS